MAWNAAKAAAAKVATVGAGAGAGVVTGGGESSYLWREKLCKYKDELAKGVWGYWHLGAWKPLAITARRRARIRKELLHAGERANTAELMRKMPEMLLNYKTFEGPNHDWLFDLRGSPLASRQHCNYLNRLRGLELVQQSTSTP